MPNLRFTLWIVLGAVLYYNYLAWQQDYRPVPQLATAGAGGAAARESLGNSVPTPEAAPSSASRRQPRRTRWAARRLRCNPQTGPRLRRRAESGGPAGFVHVATDVLDLDISLRGGEIDRAELPKYPLHKDTPNVPVRLESSDPAAPYLLQTGLAGKPGEAAPSHLAMLTAAQSSYTLVPGANELRVPLTWTDGQGLTVTKTFVFTRGGYGIDLVYDVHNDAAVPR